MPGSIRKTLVSAMALMALQWPVAAGADPLLSNLIPWTQEFSPNFQSPVRLQPYPTPDVAPYATLNPDTVYGPQYQALYIRALQQAVKYVFVIFNENESFDHEYGTLPGVNGLYSDGVFPRSPANTPGFTQTYQDLTTGLTVSVQPFGVGPAQNSTFMDSIDHSHTGLASKIDVVNGVARMDGFANDEYTRFASKGGAANEAEGKQFARLVMSHIDCQTIPFFWYWATRFTIFDNIFATEDTPSSPNAIAMIAGQSGETQWVKHGPNGIAYAKGGTVCGTVYGGGTTQGPPIVNDPQPFYGSEFDQTAAASKEPAGCAESYGVTNIASVLTFASVPLNLLGSSAASVTSQDLNPAVDLADIQQDIPYLTAVGNAPVSWRWYQNGYDHEPTDGAGPASHLNFVSHHDGAQYFGYIADNPVMSANLKGLGDFFNDIANGALPQGGVIYIRGGYTNIAGLTPPIQNPNYPDPNGLTAAEIKTIVGAKSGDDDHPSYSDRQISEAMAARVINAVAGNPAIWSKSAIIITYDESDGLYDHVPPHIVSYGPDSLPLSRGVRVPLLLISPYAHSHAVSSAEGDHNSIIETINAIFGLPALASLPDEAQALAAGNSPAFNQFGPAGFEQTALGPRDLPSPISQSLLSGFDLDRLVGRKPPIPASLAMIPDSVVNSLPHFGGTPGGACAAIGVTPEDQLQGIQNNIPAGFNTLPSTLPAYN